MIARRKLRTLVEVLALLGCEEAERSPGDNSAIGDSDLHAYTPAVNVMNSQPYRSKGYTSGEIRQTSCLPTRKLPG